MRSFYSIKCDVDDTKYYKSLFGNDINALGSDVDLYLSWCIWYMSRETRESEIKDKMKSRVILSRKLCHENLSNRFNVQHVWWPSMNGLKVTECMLWIPFSPWNLYFWRSFKHFLELACAFVFILGSAGGLIRVTSFNTFSFTIDSFSSLLNAVRFSLNSFLKPNKNLLETLKVIEAYRANKQQD